jgi:isoleucyl-tRNA synthetase
VALDLTLDTELWKRGLAREVVRQVQDLRKASGLEVSDWIHLRLVGLDFLGPHLELVGREVLAHSVETTAPAAAESGEGTTVELEDEDGSPLAAQAWVIKA